MKILHLVDINSSPKLPGDQQFHNCAITPENALSLVLASLASVRPQAMQGLQGYRQHFDLGTETTRELVEILQNKWYDLFSWLLPANKLQHF